MLIISQQLSIPDHEIEFNAIRSQGAGGQNVNKVASAIHLRFDISASSLPEHYKKRLLKLRDKRVTKEGVIVIKAQSFRDQEKNKEDALLRLEELIRQVEFTRKRRIPTKPSRGSCLRRLDGKTRQGEKKRLRRKIEE